MAIAAPDQLHQKIAVFQPDRIGKPGRYIHHQPRLAHRNRKRHLSVLPFQQYIADAFAASLAVPKGHQQSIVLQHRHMGFAEGEIRKALKIEQSYAGEAKFTVDTGQVYLVYIGDKVVKIDM